MHAYVVLVVLVVAVVVCVRVCSSMKARGQPWLSFSISLSSSLNPKLTDSVVQVGL